MSQFNESTGYNHEEAEFKRREAEALTALRAKLDAQEVIRVLCGSALAPLRGLGTSDRRLVREEPFAPGAPGPVNGTDGEIGA